MGSVGRRQEEIFRFTTHQFDESIYEDIDFKERNGDTCDPYLCQQINLCDSTLIQSNPKLLDDLFHQM